MNTRLLSIALFFLPLVLQAADAKRPNILWLIAEDFGQHLGCYGTKEVWTPNLDKLAADGVRYTRFYAGMVCSVSRSSFNTGMYATTIGAQNHRTALKKPLPDGVKPLSDWMRGAGYLAANLVELPESCGFKGTGKVDWNFTTESKPFDTSKWSDLSSKQPFYAQINFKETHRTYHGPPHADPAKVELPPYYPDHPVTRKDWAEYLDDATELDRKIGKVLESLDKDGLADNTIVIFFGDNGQSHVRGKQFCYDEGFLVPLIIRWPKNFPAPSNFKPGSVDERLIHCIDLAPTMIDITGAAKPPKMQGHIFLGTHSEPDREYNFGYRDRCDMTQMRIRTVRDKRYIYIHDFTPWVPFLARNEYKEAQYPVWNLLKELHAQGKLTPAQDAMCQPTMPEEELYDLEADPFELSNLAKSDKPEHLAALNRLRGVLDQWIVDTDDKGRNLEALDVLKASEKRFVPALDWRPPPGTPEAAQADKLRAEYQARPPDAPSSEQPKKKKKKKAA